MKQVALIYPYSVPWMGEFILGVANYAKAHEDWAILTSPPTLTGTGEYALTLHNLEGWPGDGVITAIANPSQVEAAQKLRLPLVNLSGALPYQQFPTVVLDHYASGRMAADHLLKCGFRRLAYYGIKKLYYSQRRRQGFQDRAQEGGASVDVFDEVHPLSARTTWQQRISGLIPWLKTLRPPIGIMAVHDYRARVVIDECNRLKLEVPHEVAVIGVDNDPTVCECCRPTLSSVSRNGFQQGYEAARLLDQLMAGQPAAQGAKILIQPQCVVMRRSTDTITVEDRHVTAVIRYMREHVEDPFGIKQLMRLVPISRRRLEKQFHRYLRCTPYEYLVWIRIEKAKQLLVQAPRRKLKEIASMCGFLTPIQFRIVFKRLLALSPRQYIAASVQNAEPVAPPADGANGNPVLPPQSPAKSPPPHTRPRRRAKP
jgi:LacI family transcriptional regulator